MTTDHQAVGSSPTASAKLLIMKTFKVKAGDPFGGYAIYGKKLSEKEAKELEKELTKEVDYFTSVIVEKE